MRRRRRACVMTLTAAGLLGALMGPVALAAPHAEPLTGRAVAVPTDLGGSLGGRALAATETTARQRNGTTAGLARAMDDEGGRGSWREIVVRHALTGRLGEDDGRAGSWREVAGLRWPWLHAAEQGPVEDGNHATAPHPDEPQHAGTDAGSGDEASGEERGQGPASPGNAATDVAAATDLADGEAQEADKWVWPARGETTSEFGRRWGRRHEGIDVANGVGTPVVAASDGEVSFAQAKSGYGLTVKIDHGGGLETTYSHLSAITTASGEAVAAGDRLGAMGCTGSCTGPHVHFEVRRGGAPVDPRTVLP